MKPLIQIGMITLALIGTLPGIPTSFAGSNSASPSQVGGPESVSQSRFQPLVGTQGMVVSDDREASAWGAEVLRMGGNAVDAAVATAFAMSVTRPHYAALGGGGFLVFCPKPKNETPSPCQALDYRETAPAKASKDMFIHNGKADTHAAQNGALASGTPGVTAGLLLALEKFGKLPRQKILKKPIELARKGYIFSTHSESAAAERWKEMNLEAMEIFGCKHAPCPPGTLIKQPDLARVLETISKKGKNGFYEGWVAKKLIQGLQNAGGIMTLDDLKSYQPKFREVLHGQFEGHEIISMPPPSSGGAIVIQLLSYVERARAANAFQNGYGSISSIHAILHSMSLAFADRANYFGDPDYVDVPLSKLLSSEYLDHRWKTYNPKKVQLVESEDLQIHEHQNTTHLAVIDGEGNAVSLTTTVNDNFGSAFVPPGTGVVMNNEMDDFSIQPGVPNQFGLVGGTANAIAPGKRPLSSMSPTIVRDQKGHVEVAIGAAGGPRIITSVFLSLLNRFQFNLPLVDAVAAPRIHQQWKPTPVKMEKFGFSPETQNQLKEKGYTLEEVPTLGKIHAIERLPNGRTIGVPDFRGEGAAVAQ